MVDLKDATNVAERVCLATSDQEYREQAEQARLQNEDRADLQEKTLDRHFANQVQKLDEVRRRHLLRRREALARATEGRVRALKDRVERQRMEIADRRRFTHRSDQICVGLVRIEEADD